jgi:hypothetical protein
VPLKKRFQQTPDLFGVFLDVAESGEQAGAQIGGFLKEAVVGGFPASVMPKPFLGVEFG